MNNGEPLPQAQRLTPEETEAKAAASRQIIHQIRLNQYRRLVSIEIEIKQLQDEKTELLEVLEEDVRS